jgi:hypothetical protein
MAVSVVVKSILARSFLLGHAIFAIFLVVGIKEDKRFWWLAAILFPLVVESVFTVGYRKSKEYKW